MLVEKRRHYMRRYFTIRVARILVIFERSLVLVQRRSDSKWEIPGGKVKETEDYSGAAHRELHEETGIRMRACRLICRRERELPHGGSWVGARYFQASAWEMPPELKAADTEEIIRVACCPFPDLAGMDLTDRTREELREERIARLMGHGPGT
jgi:8-oxo-dGTP pyrophosphatase MutT (NUDIX family)